jgi:hypothetical protein
VEEPLSAAIGLALVLLGAVGATVTQRRFEREGRTVFALPLLVPFGILIGAGAAIARGWHLPASMAVGGVLVPIVGASSRLLEVRRQRARRERGPR